MDQPSLAHEQFCYLTTTGRVSGEPREIEIWFALEATTVYMLAGGREKSNWVRNLRKTPAVSIRIAGREFASEARIVASNTPEDALARRLLVEKYGPGHATDLTNWGATALPVAVELDFGTPAG
jgi:deazaflavin-dependent oxidoreductase (nitroreductase family)